MDSAIWRVELAGPCPDLTEHQLRWLRPRALAKGVRLELAPLQIRASFSVSAQDLDVAIGRARARWETTAAALGLPHTRLCHFAIDEAAPPLHDSYSTARNLPRPRPRSGAAWLDLPPAATLELDDPVGPQEDRAPTRLLALR